MNECARERLARIIETIFHPCRVAGRLVETGRQFLPQLHSRINEDAVKFWRSSSNNCRAKDLSHWRGEGRWSDQGTWVQIGKTHVGMFERLCLLSGIAKPIQSMVEWGPGGGANATAFCDKVRYFFGIDISEANLGECRHQLQACGFDGFQPVLIDIAQPERCLEYVKSPVDFFLSTSVYQHFANKDYGVQITRLAYELLKDGGIALIQIRYDDGSQKFKPKHRDYERNLITFTSYGISEFWQIAIEIGFKPLAVSLEANVNYAYFYLQKGTIET